jgi:NitT/TauT family transport system substrate-binding protein
MPWTRREALKTVGIAGAAAIIPRVARSQGSEKTNIKIASGGKALIYYLPLSIAELRGYFKDEGLTVEVLNFAGGSAAVQAVVGGSADVVAGDFGHTIILQSKGQYYRTFAQLGLAPMIALGVSAKRMADYKAPADLKGKKIGVTAPGSSTYMVASFFLAKHGIKPTDVSYIGVGGGLGAVTALRTGNIDAISDLDPAISMLVKSGDLKIVTDTRTVADTKAIFGGNMPSGCLYVSQEFMDRNPNSVQAMANAITRADKWIQESSPDEIMKVVPQSYQLGDPSLYRLSLEANVKALSPDGMVPADGPQTVLNALVSFVPGLPGKKIDLSKIWTNDFAVKANKKYPHA